MPEPYDQEMLLGYVEGDLPSDQRARVEQQLREDARLRRLVDQLRQDRSMLRQLPRAKVPFDLIEQVNQRLERESLLGSPEVVDSFAPSRWSIGRLFKYSGIAALITVGLCVALIVFNDYQPSSQPMADVAMVGKQPPLELTEQAKDKYLSTRERAESLSAELDFDEDPLALVTKRSNGAPSVMAEILSDEDPTFGDTRSALSRTLSSNSLADITLDPAPMANRQNNMIAKAKKTNTTATNTDAPESGQAIFRDGLAMATKDSPTEEAASPANEPKVPLVKTTKIDLQINILSDDPAASIKHLLAFARQPDVFGGHQWLREAAPHAADEADLGKKHEGESLNKRGRSNQPMPLARSLSTTQSMRPPTIVKGPSPEQHNQIDLELSANQLAPLMAQLNSHKGQSARLAKYHALKPSMGDGRTDSALEMLARKGQGEAGGMVDKSRYRDRQESNRVEPSEKDETRSRPQADWQQHLNLPLIPEMSILDLETRLRVRVVVQQRPSSSGK